MKGFAGYLRLRVGMRGLEIAAVPDGQLRKNAVTTESAQFTGFTPLLNGSTDYFQGNHTSIGNPTIAGQILDAIRRVQPMIQ